MANVFNGNTYFVDSLGSLDLSSVRVRSIVVSPNGGAGELQLKDAGSDQLKFDLLVPSGSDPLVLQFRDYPAVFPGGVKVAIATNVKATLVLDYTQG